MKNTLRKPDLETILRRLRFFRRIAQTNARKKAKQKEWTDYYFWKASYNSYAQAIDIINQERR